jgi:hypothetical protein
MSTLLPTCQITAKSTNDTCLITHIEAKSLSIQNYLYQKQQEKKAPLAGTFFLAK